jgi:type VI secretion system protein ImpG
LALDPLVSYYQRELTYLRRASTEFAKQHPKIARRLEIGHGESSDPHVERLLESFAYLTAGLQREVDDNFPRVTSALLGVLYPHLIEPVPSMSIAQYTLDPKQGKATSMYLVEKGHPLFSRTVEGDMCQFRTSYDVDLWPIDVTEAEIINTETLPFALSAIKTSRVLRIRLESQGVPFQKLGGPENLRFYINGDRALQNILYEALFSDEAKVSVLPNAAELTDFRHVRTLQASSVTAAGFGYDDNILPKAPASHAAYRLLQEYFNFPNKFMFFDIKNIPFAQCDNSMDLFISIPERIQLGVFNVDRANFLLGCTPIINLFPKTSEPLVMDYRSHEYRLVADYRHESTTEIHSIAQVQYIEEGDFNPQNMNPYFSFSHYDEQKDTSLYWAARRVDAVSLDLSGSDIMLSFVDYNFTPQTVPHKTVYAQVMCTNRHLAEEMPRGSLLESEYPVPLIVHCVEQPTKQSFPPQDGDTQWRLISQLSLNHLPITSGDHAFKALKEILYLYASLTQEPNFPELKGLTDMKTSQIVRRVGLDAWRGFSQGTAVELSFKSETFGPGGAFLFASVLNEFLALYSAVNSFIELSIKKEEETGIWKTWQLNRGDKFLL